MFIHFHVLHMQDPLWAHCHNRQECWQTRERVYENQIQWLRAIPCIVTTLVDGLTEAPFIADISIVTPPLATNKDRCGKDFSKAVN